MSRVVKVKELTPESFNPFGSYLNVVNPVGYELTGKYHVFYRDVVRYVPDKHLFHR